MSSVSPTILIVDDEQPICDLLYDVLSQQGYVCETTTSANDALSVLQQRPFDVALLDIKMHGMSGLELLDIMAKSHASTSVIMVTAVTDTNTAVKAMKKGASDYILKPFEIEEVRSRIASVMRERALNVNNGYRSATQTRMDAIAKGVEARVERFDLHDRIVTERTIEVARQLGIPEADIDEWASARREFSSIREKRMGWVTGMHEMRSDNTEYNLNRGTNHRSLE